MEPKKYANLHLWKDVWHILMVQLPETALFRMTPSYLQDNRRGWQARDTVDWRGYVYSEVGGRVDKTIEEMDEEINS